MRLIAVRQHLRRLRRRLLQVDAAHGEALLSDCDRAMSALRLAMEEANDVDLVREQLLDLVAADVRRVVQMHPWGSSTAREPLVECELATDRLEIPIETDSLPHSLSGVVTRSCVSLDLHFELLRVKRDSTAGVAVYGASLNAIRATPDAMLV